MSNLVQFNELYIINLRNKMIILFYICTLFNFVTATLVNDCNKTPFWKLNLCQIDCDKCGTNAVCELCPEGFNLNSTTCEQESINIYHDIFFTQAQITSTDIIQNSFKVSNQYLKNTNIVRLCKSNSYKFDMIGLFKQQDRVSYNLNFDSPITQFMIRFNFITLSKNTKLEVVLNGDQIHQKIFKGSSIDNTYEPSEYSINYLLIPALTESSSKVVMNKIVIGPVGVGQSQFKNNLVLKLEVSNTDNTTSTGSFWGFSDFSVTGKKCQECIPQKLQTLSRNVGIALGINAGALFVLILILYGCVKLQERRRRTSFEEKSKYESFSEELQREEEEKQNEFKIRESVLQVKQMNKNNKKSKNG